MNKIGASFCLLLLVWGTVSAPAQQTGYRDSLLAVIGKHPDDTVKVQLYNDLYFGNDNEHCSCENLMTTEEKLQHATDMLALAQRLNYKRGMAEAYNIMGLIYMPEKKPAKKNEALRNFYAADDIYRSIGDKRYLAGSMTALGGMYINCWKYRMAMDTLVVARRLSEEVNDPLYVADAVFKIGDVYAHWKAYDRAMENYAKAQTIYKQHSYKRHLVDAYGRLAYGSLKQKKYDAALLYIDEMLALAQEVSSPEVIKAANNFKAKTLKARAKHEK